MNAGQEVDGQLVEPGADRPVLLEPPDALLNARPPAVQRFVEPLPAVAGPLILAAGDDGLDAMPPQPPADVRVAVPPVPAHRRRLPPAARNANGVQQPLELRAFLPLTAGQDGRPACVGRFYWLLVSALGVTWVLDGLEVTVGAVGNALLEPAALGLVPHQLALSQTGYLSGAIIGALFFGRVWLPADDRHGGLEGGYWLGAGLMAVAAGTE